MTTAILRKAIGIFISEDIGTYRASGSSTIGSILFALIILPDPMNQMLPAANGIFGQQFFL